MLKEIRRKFMKTGAKKRLVFSTNCGLEIDLVLALKFSSKYCMFLMMFGIKNL